MFICCSVASNSWWPHGLYPARLLCPWDFSGKNTEVGCHFLLQGIFPTRGSNLGFQHCRWILYQLSHQVSPFYLRAVLILFCLSDWVRKYNNQHCSSFYTRSGTVLNKCFKAWELTKLWAVQFHNPRYIFHVFLRAVSTCGVKLRTQNISTGGNLKDE